ncbi:adenine deaminase C-terminal domain-containing protein [Thalassobacillus pellis]|uniref:adenine deaminase C-terminal domain-containing protein n=1 Tax=Thalassobacillus pellis TaxID=748008 RepID=UPI001960D6C4|nr:adenine deaminase C-terminal domain-containing protein [Thalassobacillus pellis]MBM7553412.1 adenine deaminase [Thalassobacillus pellis]
MNEHRFRWRNRQLREHAAIIDGKLPPTKLIKNATYLNVYIKQWMEGNIWIDKDRIVYVGKELPENMDGASVIDAEGQYIVPGYVEPHSHPFQLYNPQSLALYAAKTGTTTLVNDNLMWLFLLDKKKAFSLLEKFVELPASVFWWARYDSQSALQEKDNEQFSENVLPWLQHDAVIQGGELTAWPEVMKGDDQMLYWMQETTRLRKPVEGHLPGASERTLTKMRLLGVDSDHESMTADDVVKRLEIGYSVGLRYSSIRPDLPDILKELVNRNHTQFDRMMLTTDGSTPGFYESGIMNPCIKIAIEAGVPVIDAYLMASYQPARHFGLDYRIGSIAPGRTAHLNFLSDPEDPVPHSIIAKGEWVKRNGKEVLEEKPIHWMNYGVTPLHLKWELHDDDLEFSMPLGMEMVNDVIMKPYAVKLDASTDVLPDNQKESFLLLIDREGEWRVNTILKGYTSQLGGLVSSYSNTGDIVLIGKRKTDMKLAFNRMREIGGGIVLAHKGKIIFEMPLKLSGVMSDKPMETVMEKEKDLREILQSFGYPFGDPVYTLLFLSSVHLPYIRITPVGILDVKKKEVLFPAIMR